MYGQFVQSVYRYVRICMYRRTDEVPMLATIGRFVLYPGEPD